MNPEELRKINDSIKNLRESYLPVLMIYKVVSNYHTLLGEILADHTTLLRVGDITEKIINGDTVSEEDCNVISNVELVVSRLQKNLQKSADMGENLKGLEL